MSTFSLQYQRIERCAKQEKASFYDRVSIYRRIPLNQDPTFADLRERLKEGHNLFFEKG